MRARVRGDADSSEKSASRPRGLAAPEPTFGSNARSDARALTEANHALEIREFWYSGLSNEESQFLICVYSMDGSLEGAIPTPGCLDESGPPSTWSAKQNELAQSPPVVSKP